MCMQQYENWDDFHYLIEISVKLQQYVKENQDVNTPNSRKNLKKWMDKLDRWLKVNYDDAGINKKAESHLFMS